MADDEGAGGSSQGNSGSKSRDRRVAKEKIGQLTKIREDAQKLEKDDKPEVHDIMNLLAEANKLDGSGAKVTRVAIVDAQVNCDVSKLGLKSIKAQNAGQQQFTAKDFICKLSAGYEQINGGDDGDAVRIDWETMRVHAAEFFDATPSCHFLACDLSKQVAKKARKARQVVSSQRRVGEESQPTYGFEQGDEANKKNSEKRKRQIMEQLNKDKSIVMADLVINPHSFGETVENLFACGVMVSEGYAGIKKKDNPVRLIIESAEPPEEQDELEDKRAIIKLDYAMFQRMIEQRNITSPHFKFDPEAKDATIEMDDEAEQSAAQTLPASSGKKQRAG